MFTECNLFFKDLESAVAPGPLLTDAWLCRKCSKLPADHPKQSLISQTTISPPTTAEPSSAVTSVSEVSFKKNTFGKMSISGQHFNPFAEQEKKEKEERERAKELELANSREFEEKESLAPLTVFESKDLIHSLILSSIKHQW